MCVARLILIVAAKVLAVSGPSPKRHLGSSSGTPLLRLLRPLSGEIALALGHNGTVDQSTWDTQSELTGTSPSPPSAQVSSRFAHGSNTASLEQVRAVIVPQTCTLLTGLCCVVECRCAQTDARDKPPLTPGARPHLVDAEPQQVEADHRQDDLDALRF